MKQTLTDSQRLAVETDGVDLCVVAGAGTGKTRVLTERIVHRIAAGRTDLARVLAITFTEKAAAEMKSRLALALERAGHASAREQVDAAAISTIHALCARLLRENAVEAGLDPQFRVLDEIASDARQRAALDAFAADLAAADRAAFEALSRLPGEDPAETLLAAWRAARESGREPGEFVAAVREMPARSVHVEQIREDLAGAAREATKGAAVAKVAAARTAFTALEAALPSDACAAAVASLATSFDLRVPANVKPWLENVRASCDALLAQLAEEALAPLRAALAAAVSALEQRYDEAKGRGAELDFVDLERRAVRLLATRDDVRAAVRARWSEVLVDEYQDVNPLQAQLVDLVRSERGLFVVGDPKQAIYGFRGSDVEVFVAARAQAAAGAGREIALAESFRSRAEVLRVVNGVFAEGFDLGPPLTAARGFRARQGPCVEVFRVDGDSAGDGRAAEAAWIARRIAALVEGPEALEVAEPTPEDPLAVRRARFGDVAILLRAMSDVKLLERALTARDIPYAVVKGRGFFEVREVIDLANLLACVDNPRDDLVLASVLRSPACGLGDDALFLLCRARDERRALVDVVLSGAHPALPSRERDLLARFVATFKALRARRTGDTIASLVESALAATRLETFALARPNGRQRAANLRKVRALARQADAAGADLRAFVATVRDLREREVRETEAPVSGGGSTAVSILTVHAAKGLEFPVVFVPDLSRGGGGSRSSVVSHPREGLGLLAPAGAGPLADTTPWAFARIEEANRERERAEADRLLYVALTRAEERLVLTTSLTARAPREGTWWERVSAALASRIAADDVLAHETQDAQVAERPGTRTLFHRVERQIAQGRIAADEIAPEARAEADALVAEAARAAPAFEGTLYSATVSGLVSFDRCPQEFRLRHVVAAPESLAGALAADEAAPDAARPGDGDEFGVALSARALGRAVHLALERLVPEFGEDVALVVREALASESGGAPVAASDVERLVGWVQGFAASEIGREVRAARREDVRREQAILFTAGAAASSGGADARGADGRGADGRAAESRTVVRGQMDLVYRGPRGWTVVDYKAGGADALRRDYVVQMRLYALGLAAITREPPARLVLFSLPDARAIEIACSPADAADLRAGLVAEFLDRTRRSDYAPRAAPPCAACAYARRCSFVR